MYIVYIASVYTGVMEIFIVKQLVAPMLSKLFKSVTVFLFMSISSVFCD